MEKINKEFDLDSEYGKTPLWLGKFIKKIACMKGYYNIEYIEQRQEVIRVLLESKSNPNAINTITKMTCLHWACSHPKDAITVQRLIEAGADPFVRDCQNLTPIDIAGMKSKDQSNAVLDYMLEYFDNYIRKNTKLEDTKFKDDEEPVAVIKTSLFLYDKTEKHYLDILYWASYRNKIGLVKKLIDLKISPFLNYFMNKNALIGAIKEIGRASCRERVSSPV